MTLATLPTVIQVAAHPRGEGASEHEIATQLCLARNIARLIGGQVQEPYRPGVRGEPPSCYLIPHHTLVAPVHEAALGISRESQLFGGMVPQDFVATKAITHGAWRAESTVPLGWNHALAQALGDTVLTGYTAFTAEDALAAGIELLARGPVRLKPVYANAGRGQHVVYDAASLQRVIGDAEEIQRGLVIEENLQELDTYSVGWCRVGRHTLAYVGTQGLTPDNQGQSVYGGSVLRCIRGEPNALLALEMSPNERLAVTLAIRYDQAVSAAYPSLIASRRNYDVAIGTSSHGEPRAGVLEQSWRAGGASIAETAALLYFAQHPDATEIRAYTQERYGAPAAPVASEHLVYTGKDSRVGWLTKTGGIVEEVSGDA